MLTYTDFEYITEAKNVHMEHVEDELFNNGYTGGLQALAFLDSVTDMLAGQTSGKSKVTVKWDGAPAVFAGINPENGKFFVASKSLFNKTPKINYTTADVDANHTGGLAVKLKTALNNLSLLGIKGILQGDIMFTKGDIKKQNIDGESMQTFQPNTIVYAVPEGSALANQMTNAEIGVVFHTAYSGETIADLSASFGPDISYLKKTNKVWFQDAEYTVANGATFSATETQDLKGKIKQAYSLLKKAKRALDGPLKNPSIVADVKIYTNANVRKGTTTLSAREFISYLENKMQVAIDKLKSDKAKERKEKDKNKMVDLLGRNAGKLDQAFQLHALITNIKIHIVRKLETLKGIGTFVKTNDGFKVTAPEGFVAIDTTGAAVKLVDRLEFSKQNFTAAKNWDK